MRKKVKTIEEALSECAPNESIKVGAGSAFFYCGKTKDYKDASCKFCDEIRIKYSKSISEASETINRNLTKIREYQSAISELECISLKSLCYGNEDTILEELKKEEKLVINYKKANRALTAANKKLMSASEKLNNFEKIPNRQVSKEYTAPISKEKIIVIKGDENAKYWDEEEFNNGVDPDDEKEQSEGDDDELD